MENEKRDRPREMPVVPEEFRPACRVLVEMLELGRRLREEEEAQKKEQGHELPAP